MVFIECLNFEKAIRFKYADKCQTTVHYGLLKVGICQKRGSTLFVRWRLKIDILLHIDLFHKYKHILSKSGWLFIKFSNAFVFPDPEPPINNIQYVWSGIYGHFKLCSVLFSFV